MEILNQLINDDPTLLRGAKIVYDAEAIFCLRDVEKLKLAGKTPAEQTVKKLIQEEVGLAGHADIVLSVSEQEADVFRRYGCSHVMKLGHALESSTTSAPFDQRNGLLFVGPVYSRHSPNADSIVWLRNEILPALHQLASHYPRLQIVGYMDDSMRKTIESDLLESLGRVDQLESVYDRARVFLAPTRFSAGIPHKVHEAAAHGVPVVATRLLAEQLGWKNDRELLVADTTDEFARACHRLYHDEQLWQQLQANAAAAVLRDCSVDEFRQTVQSVYTTNAVSYPAAVRAA